MIKLNDWDKGMFNEFKTAEEVACATQVAEVVEKSGIELTRSIELLIKMLQSPVLNFIINAKIAELMIPNEDIEKVTAKKMLKDRKEE